MNNNIYDIWYLLEEQGMDAGFYMNEFEAKCKCKDLEQTDFVMKLTERLPQYKGRWQSSLSEQIKTLPDFDQVEREVKKAFKEIKKMGSTSFCVEYYEMFTENR